MGKIALVIVGIILLAGLAIVGMGIGSYNNLTTKGIDVDAKWSQVENQMQRRADLIPNIVGTIKGITKQEQDVFVKIAEARSKLLSATTPEGKIAADQQ
ncbi:MAG: LemA family protein, partial [Blastocatellia bacterium]